jgi:hypothetical protein
MTQTFCDLVSHFAILDSAIFFGRVLRLVNFLQYSVIFRILSVIFLQWSRPFAKVLSHFCYSAQPFYYSARPFYDFVSHSF